MGFIAEVAYSAVKKGKLINRGFLNGAWCPIYGTGALAVSVCLFPFKNNPVLLFLTSFAVTSFIEFITGFTLEKIYKCRWWDYSDRRFNIGGYICLEFSLVWGAVGAVFIKVINPIMIGLLGLIPLWLGMVLLSLLLATFITDAVISVMAANHLVLHIKELNKIAEDMQKVSDEMSKAVYKNAIELKERQEARKNRLSSLRETYENALAKKSKAYPRLIKAFPNLRMIHAAHQEQLEKLKNRIAEKITKTHKNGTF